MSILEAKVVDDLLHERSLSQVDTFTNVMDVDADEASCSAFVFGVKSLQEGFLEGVPSNGARWVCRKEEIVDVKFHDHDLGSSAIVGRDVFKPDGIVVSMTLDHPSPMRKTRTVFVKHADARRRP